jgi:hypothetical protein
MSDARDPHTENDVACPAPKACSAFDRRRSRAGTSLPRPRPVRLHTHRRQRRACLQQRHRSPGGLTDPGGNNQLTLPAGGTGTIAGNVTFSAGTDTVIAMDSGRIERLGRPGQWRRPIPRSARGSVAGQVQQGEGVDHFAMTGGEINVAQPGRRARHLPHVGRPDRRCVRRWRSSHVMTGGRIGRVNMKLADNLFDMSGGTIDRNLVTGFGNDTIILSGGTIGGNISVSGGTDSVTDHRRIGRRRRTAERRHRPLRLGRRRRCARTDRPGRRQRQRTASPT